MKRTLCYASCVLFVVVALVAIGLVGCGPGERYAGLYAATGGGGPQQGETAIELKENGEGIWRTGDHEVSLRWSARGKEVRLHTKEGGIIMGKMKGNTLELILPGERVLSLTRTQSY
jgi:hypothetical protein